MNNRDALLGNIGSFDLQHAAVSQVHTGILTLLPDVNGKPMNYGFQITDSGHGVGEACEATLGRSARRLEAPNRSERIALEQIATAYWLLARATRSESDIRQARHLMFEAKLHLLERVYAQRTRLERSLANGLTQLQRLQKERRAASPRR